MTTSSDTSPSAKAIRCANCDQQNPSDRKFCGECGGRLWETCTECGATHAIDEKFCGSCGTNLASSLDERKGQIEKKLKLAIDMEREGRFFDAAAALRQISANGDPRLESYQQNALKLLDQLNDRKSRRSEEAEHFEVVAQEHFEAHQYDLALDAINSIPPGLRNRQIEDLREETQRRHDQVQSLYADIRTCLKKKQTDGLLEKVQRFCELQPHHEEATKLVAKLEKQRAAELSNQAQRLAVLAHKKIQSGEYRAAAQAARGIESQYRKGKIEQVFRTAQELAWYQSQLQTAPWATGRLLKIAKRWVKACPDDPTPQHQLETLKTKLDEPIKDRRFQTRPWAAAKPSSERHAVKRWTGITKALVDDAESQSTLAKHPGQFFTAYGLALQGLGQAAFKHDLNPNKGSWGRFLTKRKMDRIWGVDLGATSLKAIELSWDAKEESLEIHNAIHLVYSKPIHECDEEERVAVYEETVREFVETIEAKKPSVILGLPSHMTLPRFFSLPPIKSKKTSLDETVRFEMKHQIPLPLEEAVYDYFAWEMSHASFEERQSITSVAARKEDVEQWIRPVTAAGCDVAMVQCDAFALYNTLHHEMLDGKDTEFAVAVLDIGGDATNLIVAENRFVWTRSIFFGTKRFNNSIVRDLKLTKAQAEQVRLDPSRAKWMHRVDETLQPDFAEIRDDFERSVRGYPKKSGTPLQLLLGVGGGFEQHGLLASFVQDNQSPEHSLERGELS